YMRGRVGRDGDAALGFRNVEQLRLLAIGRGPEIVAARFRGADAAGRAAAVRRLRLGVGLQILRRIVIDRLSGLAVDALGPGEPPDILRRLQELAVGAVENILKAVAAGMRQELARLAIDGGVDQDMRAGLVEIAIVVRRILVEPLDLAGRGIE